MKSALKDYQRHNIGKINMFCAQMILPEGVYYREGRDICLKLGFHIHTWLHWHRILKHYHSKLLPGWKWKNYFSEEQEFGLILGFLIWFRFLSWDSRVKMNSWIWDVRTSAFCSLEYIWNHFGTNPRGFLCRYSKWNRICKCSKRKGTTTDMKICVLSCWTKL